MLTKDLKNFKAQRSVTTLELLAIIAFVMLATLDWAGLLFGDKL